jgi:uncharacterized phage-associated protein
VKQKDDVIRITKRSYFSLTIANQFLEIADKEGVKLTNMQLQKLVYFAHGWHLAFIKEPLLHDPISAWCFGPVIPPLYDKLRKFGNGIVTSKLKIKIKNFEFIDAHVLDLLQAVWRAYGHLSGGQMSWISKQPGTPWQQVWDQCEWGVIPNILIQKHFEELKGEG